MYADALINQQTTIKPGAKESRERLFLVNSYVCDSWSLMKWRYPGHAGTRGICRMFYTSEIPFFSIYLKKRKSHNFWQKIDSGGCFTHLLGLFCQFLCNYLLRYELNPIILWKLNFTARIFFGVISRKIYLIHLWQIPSLYAGLLGDVVGSLLGQENTCLTCWLC